MKGLLAEKHKLREIKIVALTQDSSAAIKERMPPKVNDPGSFSISCMIGNQQVGRALYDLETNVNLMPLSFVKSLGITKMKSTLMYLQIVDRTIKKLEEVLDDVLVKVNDYIFPVDFVMLNMEEDVNMPLILERSFLATARALINMEQER
ncbi:uncharacterized protein LOC133315198 [Gastrolobium bilobum]|uniref:uncharacterized protein LOC133315198 n=1 Tax=Gastrolobium bilobum TaxID=150636 RepID=UPI002AB30EE7|nr:uncharacterized protein LOC133315198 [Gastrolobium bilobum]